MVAALQCTPFDGIYLESHSGGDRPHDGFARGLRAHGSGWGSAQRWGFLGGAGGAHDRPGDRRHSDPAARQSAAGASARGAARVRGREHPPCRARRRRPGTRTSFAARSPLPDSIRSRRVRRGLGRDRHPRSDQPRSAARATRDGSPPVPADVGRAGREEAQGSTQRWIASVGIRTGGRSRGGAAAHHSGGHPCLHELHRAAGGGVEAVELLSHAGPGLRRAGRRIRGLRRLRCHRVSGCSPACRDRRS